MKFTHKTPDSGLTDIVSIKENKGLSVSFSFSHDSEFASEWEIELATGYMRDIEADSLYVGIDNEIISLKALAVKAAMYLAEIRKEGENDAQIWNDHIRSVGRTL